MVADIEGALAGRLRDDPEFRRFWLARVVSMLGSTVTYVALPVLVYRLTGSPLLTGIVAALEALPYLLFGLFAGALADRTDRRWVMVASDLVSAVVVASVPVAAAFGALTVPHLLLCAFLVPAGFVFFDAAEFGAVPLLAGRDRLAEANSAIWGVGSAIELVALPLAGAALAVFDASSLLALDGLSFLASALLVRSVRRSLSSPREAAVTRLRAQVGEGLRHLWNDVPARLMTVVGTLQCVAGGAFMGQLVVWADRDLGVREGDPRLGVLFGTWSIGSLVATLALPAVTRRTGAAGAIVVAAPASALLCVATALSPDWVTGSVVLALWGSAYMLVVVNAVTYRQQVTPEHLLSRVGTTGRMLSFGLGWPIGSLLGGVVAGAAGPVAGMLAGSAALVVGALVATSAPMRRAARAHVPLPD
jgi:Transmembrane secretion effector